MAKAPAVPKSAAWPPRTAILVLGVILSISLGIGVATLREISSGTVRGSRDVFELCGAPPIALIPIIQNGEDRMKRRVYALGFLAGVVAIGMLAFWGAHVL